MLHFLKISQLLAVGCWRLFCLVSQRASETSSHCLSSACTEDEYVTWKKWLLCIIFVLGREHTASGQKRESLQSVQQLVWHTSLCHSSGLSLCHTPPTIHVLLTQLSVTLPCLPNASLLAQVPAALFDAYQWGSFQRSWIVLQVFLRCWDPLLPNTDKIVTGFPERKRWISWKCKEEISQRKKLNELGHIFMNLSLYGKKKVGRF